MIISDILMTFPVDSRMILIMKRPYNNDHINNADDNNNGDDNNENENNENNN